MFGGKLTNLNNVFHGIATNVTLTVTNEPLFKGLNSTFKVGRYHSWVVSKEDFPDALEVTSLDENGQIMSLRHRDFDICAVQYHPESVLTPDGKIMIKNWVNS